MITMEAGGWYQLGVPFAQLNGTTTFTLDEAFPGFAEGDRLYVATEDGGYRFRYWMADATNGTAGWSIVNTRYRADNTLYTQGTAVYIYKETTGSIALSGAVKQIENTFGSELGRTWNLVALPWPEAKKLSDYTWTNCEEGDTLYIGTPDGGFRFRYWKIDTATGNAGWSIVNTRYREDTTPLSAGTAVYINKVSAGVGTVTLK